MMNDEIDNEITFINSKHRSSHQQTPSMSNQKIGLMDRDTSGGQIVKKKHRENSSRSSEKYKISFRDEMKELS